ncbi:hypothetical protein GDO78_013336 [Eleutherodactylus coqui]|uniref:mRNA decay activator protein ZFP36 n=2 Tax=Eleutherodactylus coqui TaxID=57060 RepID=A0A8J6F002_ELECQ|nr:hypothetical protein GDO78_013336 [Eleutherodactylus coqui]
MSSLVQPPQNPWSQDSELPTLTAPRLIPSQADHSISMTEESKGSPPSTPSTSRYKTELCRSYQLSGYCRYDEKCQFAHGPSELRVICRHPKYKTELCRTYHTTGFCPYGIRCHFIHNIEEEKLNNSKKGQCPPFLRQSISCSGIPSMSSSSSGSLFSSHMASPASLPIFPPISPLSPTSPLGSSGFWSPSPVPLGPALLGLVTPPRSTVQNPWTWNPQMKPLPCEQEEPKMADNRDCLIQQKSIEESTTVCDDSEEAKRLPIFSSISD